MLLQNRLVTCMLSFATVFAVPLEHEDRLEDIQCRCISFSTSAKPTLCTYLESHGIDWHTAYSLASDNDLKIQFASKTTISKVLAIRKPLPTTVLRTLDEGAAQPLESAALLQSENKIICGLGDEAEHMGTVHSYEGIEPELDYISGVLEVLMLSFIVYVCAVHLYNRFTAKEGNIKLEGDEKNLTAMTD